QRSTEWTGGVRGGLRGPSGGLWDVERPKAPARIVPEEIKDPHRSIFAWHTHFRAQGEAAPQGVSGHPSVTESIPRCWRSHDQVGLGRAGTGSEVAGKREREGEGRKEAEEHLAGTGA